MKFIRYIRPFESTLIVVGLLIAFVFLYISHVLVDDLAVEERVRMELWADAMKVLKEADEKTNLTMVLEVLNANNTIPVVVVDQNDVIQTFRNVDISNEDTLQVLQRYVDEFKREGHSLRIGSSESEEFWQVCYGNSVMLSRLSIYPYIQLIVVLVFVMIAILALLAAKRAEQNKVWVGLSKETAHQLGTPISSLMAWMELLMVQYPENELLPEMNEDVKRLQMIANRFSKIGSVPELEDTDLNLLMKKVADYVKMRSSDRVSVRLQLLESSLMIRLNAPLFEWVIENLCKNAIDAMNGVGLLTLTAGKDKKNIYIEVADTGKGIERHAFYKVFSPGYTTKKRGWGLGLSLAHRIVEEYHFGRIFVKQSELNKGTIFRIEFKK